MRFRLGGTLQARALVLPLPQPAGETPPITRTSSPRRTPGRLACPLLAAIHKPGPSYVKCGVILAELSPEGKAQAGLFDRKDTARSSELMRALDSINAEHGRGSLVFAGSGLSRVWAGRADMESPHYTTDWRQVPVVRA